MNEPLHDMGPYQQRLFSLSWDPCGGGTRTRTRGSAGDGSVTYIDTSAYAETARGTVRHSTSIMTISIKGCIEAGQGISTHGLPVAAGPPGDEHYRSASAYINHLTYVYAAMHGLADDY